MLFQDEGDTGSRKHRVPLRWDILACVVIIVLVAVILLQFGWFGSPEPIWFDGREIRRTYNAELVVAPVQKLLVQ